MIFFTKYPSKNRILPLIHLVFCPLGHLDFYPGNGKGLYGAHQPGCNSAIGKKNMISRKKNGSSKNSDFYY